MRIIIKSFYFVVLIMFLFSCSGRKTYTVGYLNPDFKRERFVQEGNFMTEKLSEYGIETLVMGADDDDAIQLQQGYELLAKGVDVLVIAAINGNTIAPLVRDAMNKGVIVIAYNMLIYNVKFDMFVTGNIEDNARLFCNAALSNRPKGNYVILGGDRFDRNGFVLKQYIDSILKPQIDSGNIKMLYETFVERWDRKRAAYEFQQVVDAYGIDIDAVIACNDPMGLGVTDVLKKYGKEGKVIVTGQDATLEGVKAVYNGTMQMTIYHPRKTLGYKVADLINEMRNGAKPKRLANSETFNGLLAVPTFQVNSIAVTKNNISEVLINNGEYTREQIVN